MLKVILSFIDFVYSIFKKLPDDKKAEIIDSVVEFFDGMLRAFFRSFKNGAL